MDDLRGSENYLEVFKIRDPRMREFGSHGQKRILFYTGDCEDGYSSFTSQSLSKKFTDFAQGRFDDNRAILPRAISLIEGLQASHHHGTPLGEYPHQAEEYPALYLDLVQNLTDDALDVIGNFEKHSNRSPSDLVVREGKAFAATLHQDRIYNTPRNDNRQGNGRASERSTMDTPHL